MRSPLPQSDRSALNGSWTKASHPASSTHPTGSPPDARLESASARFRSKTAALRLLPTFPTYTSSSTLILDSPLRTRGLSRSSSPSPPLSSKVGSRCSVPSPILVPNVDRSFAASHQHHRTTPTFQPVHQRSRTRADFRDHPAGTRGCLARPCRPLRRRRSTSVTSTSSSRPKERSPTRRGPRAVLGSCNTQHPERTSTTVPATATVCTRLRSLGASGAALMVRPVAREGMVNPSPWRHRRRPRETTPVPPRCADVVQWPPSNTSPAGFGFCWWPKRLLTPTTATSTFSM